MDADNLAYLSIQELSRLLQSAQLSPVEVTQAILGRTERLEPTLHSYITLADESALADARRAEREIMSGHWRGPLHGVPVNVKDFFWTKGVRTTAGSCLFREFVPSEDSAVVDLLRQQGAVILGKTNTPELGWTKFEQHGFGIPRNPWNLDHYPGASSSGSAVGVAAGLTYGSVGTDTAGSIRHPAVFCGVTALKPTNGRVSLYGTIPLCPNLDTAGPIARSVMDCAHMLDALTWSDPRDSRSLSAAAPERGWAATLNQTARPGTIGVPRTYFWGEVLQQDVRACAEAALGVWQSLGWQLEEVELPAMDPVSRASHTIVIAEAATTYREVLTESPDSVGSPFHELADPGLAVLASDYIRALDTMRDFGGVLSSVFEHVDVLVTPTRAGTAPAMAADGRLLEPLPAESFRAPFNFPGVPAMTIPCGFGANGLPTGVQIVGPYLREDLVLAAGHAFQQATDWHLRRPSLP